MKLVYFAWVRERIGVPEEQIDVPGEVATVRDLLGWLSGPSIEVRVGKMVRGHFYAPHRWRHVA